MKKMFAAGGKSKECDQGSIYAKLGASGVSPQHMMMYQESMKKIEKYNIKRGK